jgi:two-component sensor histidine kinase
VLGSVVPDTTHDIVLMVSELATNACNHGATGFEVRVIPPESGAYIRVEVADDAPGKPALRHPPPSDTNGRGLHIVATLSDRWGVTSQEKDKEKCVWFSVRVPSAASTGDLTPPS